jgi:hypothetical protein
VQNISESVKRKKVEKEEARSRWKWNLRQLFPWYIWKDTLDSPNKQALNLNWKLRNKKNLGIQLPIRGLKSLIVKGFGVIPQL